jgi:hypothetical protein
MVFDKIDAPLLMVWRSWRLCGVDVLRRYVALWGVSICEGVGYLELSVHCTEDLIKDPKWTGKIASHELLEGTRSGRVPVDLVEELSAHPAVSMLKLARRHRLLRSGGGR